MAKRSSPAWTFQPSAASLIVGICCVSPGCADPPEPSPPSRTGPPLQAPFTCGDVDLYDIDAILSGGALEGKCSDVPIGTWRRIAADLREATRCDHAPDYVPDPDEACDIAACANSLYAGAAASTCDDFTALDEAMRSPPCGPFFVVYSYRLLPC